MTQRPRRADYLLELWLAGTAAGAEIGRRLRAFGIEAHLFALLTHIAHREPVTPSAIAAEQGIPVTTMRDNVQRLVDRGLVRRVPNPHDGRSYLLVRTPEGERMLEVGSVVMAGLYGALGTALPRSEAEYAEMLRELRHGVATLTAAPEPAGAEDASE
jgi:DNA-binding MarR family transcriptional regulator